MKVRCGYCKQFIDRDTAIRRNLNYFCGDDCYYSKINQSKKKKNTSKGKVDLDSTREDILKKDGYRCRYCGGRNNLVTHHVIYKSEKKNKQWQETQSNLITLCNFSCHLDIIHGNKKKYQPLCLKVIWLREINGDKLTLIKDLEND